MAHPSVDMETPRVAVASGCVLGEGPVWDHRNDTLLWVDIKDPAIWRYHPATGKHSRMAVPERVGFVALTHDPDILIAGFKSGLVRFNLWGGEIQPLVSPELDKPRNRINDGDAGRMAAFISAPWTTTRPNRAARSGAGTARNSCASGTISSSRTGRPSAPTGRQFILIDTLRRTIHAQTLAAGGPGEPRLLSSSIRRPAIPTVWRWIPRAILWVCHWGGSRITRLAPDGQVERIVPLHTAQVTKCAFAGPDLTTLYVTTAAIGRDPHIDPMAGHLYVSECGVRGLPTNIFEG